MNIPSNFKISNENVLSWQRQRTQSELLGFITRREHALASLTACDNPFDC